MATPLSLCVVTATTNVERARGCIGSWGDGSGVLIHAIANGTEADPYLGVVPAFRRGIDLALADGLNWDLIACLHDDLLITDPDWVAKVGQAFADNPRMGLAGFCGASGLGDDNLYQVPYEPQQLARHGVRSNMRDAEAHGARSLVKSRVACLDGFSQIGRREFWLGTWLSGETPFPNGVGPAIRPFTELEDLGMVHHFYDGALGCLAARHGWETWYLPIACHHFGGRTAVGDAGYQEWAQGQVAGGDAGFWQEAHRIGYDAFRDVLPLRVGG